MRIKHNLDGLIKYLDISDQDRAVPVNSPDVQVFDLPNTPDSLFDHVYTFQEKILVGGGLGYPLVIGDFNHNGLTDFTGMYKIIQDYEIGQAGIIERQSDGDFELQWLADYSDSAVTPLAMTDIDEDGLLELNVKRTQDFYNYESTSADSFPDSLNFKYRMWQISGAVGSETFVHLDQDNQMDVIYVGDDSLPPSGQKVYVAEYDPQHNNFMKRFSQRPPDWRVSGFSVGDFDEDGKKEFFTGSIHGNIYGFENTGNDAYQIIFTDSIPTPNAYLTCATNDIDGNGKPEFFLGGSSYYYGVSGTQIFWYEANGDNHYQRLRSIFLIGTGVLGTTELYSYDADGDGQDDLVFAFSSYVVILKWNRMTELFDLVYLKYINLGYSEIQSANIFDVNEDSSPDLLVSVEQAWYLPRVFTFYYTGQSISSIKNRTNMHHAIINLEVFPNPFNKNIIIRFNIRNNLNANISVFNLSGKEVKQICNKKYSSGTYQLNWNGENKSGKEVASGIYFIRFQSGKQFLSKKILFLK